VTNAARVQESYAKTLMLLSINRERVYTVRSIKFFSSLKPVMITGFFYGCAASRHFCSAQAVNLKMRQARQPGRVQVHKEGKVILSDPRPSL